MIARVNQSFDSLMQQARAGDDGALGRLLESYDAYLKFVASSLLRVAPRTSVDISDVVQETKFKACQGFPRFEGSDEPQLVCWLREILRRHVLNILKKHGPPGRRPESLEALLDRSGGEAHRALAVVGSSVSTKASRREQAALTAEALESLEPQYKQVLVLHYFDGLAHAELAERMGGTEGGSRMLLMRAARALKQKIQESID